MINSFKNYLVEEDRSAYFTFGRMNPPTIGHEKLLQVLSQKAGKNPYKVYLSQSVDSNKNPLDYTQKVKIARKMFPKYARSIMLDKKIKNVFDVLVKLHNDGNKKITMVVGSDRIREFEVLLAKYNGVKGRHGFYHFERIDVISAGDRDPDADDASGMSASKMRAAAKDNNFTQFSQGLPKNVRNADAKQIYNAVRSGMGLKEQKEFKNHIQLEPVSDLREAYMFDNIFKEGEEVVIPSRGGIVGNIKYLGANYLIVESKGETWRCWLNEVDKLDPIAARALQQVSAPYGATPERGVYKENLNEGSLVPFRDTLDEMGMPELLHRLVMAPKMKKLVRAYLNWKRKNPGKGRRGVYDFIKQIGVPYSPRDGNQLIDVLNKMVDSGKLPKHLAVEDVDPNLKQKQDNEIERLKNKHDRELDRARLKKVMLKNRETK